VKFEARRDVKQFVPFYYSGAQMLQIGHSGGSRIESGRNPGGILDAGSVIPDLIRDRHDGKTFFYCRAWRFNGLNHEVSYE
jgi:hypothetical protein